MSVISQSKPIVLVYLNHTLLPGNKGMEWIHEMQGILESRWSDYHVMCIPDPDQKRLMQVQTWYEKSLREEDFKAFQKHVDEMVSKLIPKK